MFQAPFLHPGTLRSLLRLRLLLFLRTAPWYNRSSLRPHLQLDLIRLLRSIRPLRPLRRRVAVRPVETLRRGDATACRTSHFAFAGFATGWFRHHQGPCFSGPFWDTPLFGRLNLTTHGVAKGWPTWVVLRTPIVRASELRTAAGGSVCPANAGRRSHPAHRCCHRRGKPGPEDNLKNDGSFGRVLGIRKREHQLLVGPVLFISTELEH